VKPPRSILDPKFKYRSAAATDVAATFRRVRAEQAKVQDERLNKVIRIRSRNGT
jgi:hypothetical protein